MKQINGNELELDLSDPQVSAHFSNPYNYTKEIIEQFDQDIYKGIVTQADKVVIDLGANVGLFALHVLPYVKKIVCVEPTPEHMLIQKKLLSQVMAKQTVPMALYHEESAINNYTGTANFHRTGINSTMNSLHHQNRDAAFQVACLTLPDLLAKYNLDHVDLAKVDIEGGEDFAITTELLKACNGKIKRFFIELHPGNIESQEKFTKIFEDAGFKVKRSNNDALICSI